jgi:protein-S-isoprenylcysteine O-methyltransferase Ste14
VPGGAPPIHPLMRVPVPWVFALGYLAGLGLQLLVPIRVHPAAARWIQWVGWGLLAVGGTVAVWCLTIFRRRRTTTIPFGHSTELVTWGPYRVSRNPMYVSLTLIYLGETALLAQAWPLLTLAPVIVYMNGVVIPYEESRLGDAFGTAYEEYAGRVKRWMGRRP